jgi:hypothetical protein
MVITKYNSKDGLTKMFNFKKPLPYFRGTMQVNFQRINPKRKNKRYFGLGNA